jgi:hypothetical protein
VSGGGKTPTFRAFPVFRLAVMEKCCDACGNEEYYFRSGCTAPQGAGVWEATTAVKPKSMGHTMCERWQNDSDFLCISCI